MATSDIPLTFKFPQPLPETLWSDQQRSSALTPLYITRFTGPRLTQVELSKHTFWELLFSFNSRGKLQTPDLWQELEAGSVVLIPPHLPHREQSDMPGWDTLWIGLQGEELAGLPTDRLVVATAPDLLPWIEILYGWHRRQVGTLGPELDSAVRFLLHAVLRLARRDARTSDWLERVIDYVQSHLDEPLSVPDLARIAGCSEGHLHRAFKDSMGLTPWQYVTRERLELATLYLRESSHSVRDIAARVGFRDPLYFSRVFHQQTGRAPSAIRRTSLPADPG